MEGKTPQGQHWLGTMGNYLGTFASSFVNVPATGQLAYFRFHEFFCFEDNQIIEVHLLWDLPQLMMLANAWPMAPQLGAHLCTPAPMSGDGLNIPESSEQRQKLNSPTIDNQALVKQMLAYLCQHPSNPDPKVMQLRQFWHPKMNWYGPTGIGTARGMTGFRHWHQIPFLRAMPDRQVDESAGLFSHWFSEGDYVAETGWPNMRLTISDDGWLGIAPSNQPVVLKSLDFWRLQDGKIRENWVLIDLLDLFSQIGVDIFARMNELTKTRQSDAVNLHVDY